MARIMTIKEIEEAEKELNDYATYIQEGTKILEKTFTLYKTDTTINSLFKSGTFGKGNEKKLEYLKEKINSYNKAMFGEGKLFQETYKFLQEQKVSAKGSDSL